MRFVEAGAFCPPADGNRRRASRRDSWGRGPFQLQTGFKAGPIQNWNTARGMLPDFGKNTRASMGSQRGRHNTGCSFPFEAEPAGVGCRAPLTSEVGSYLRHALFAMGRDMSGAGMQADIIVLNMEHVPFSDFSVFDCNWSRFTFFTDFCSEFETSGAIRHGRGRRCGWHATAAPGACSCLFSFPIFSGAQLCLQEKNN